MSDILQSFMGLFKGSQLAHGVWQKENGHMSTVLSPPTDEDYRKHLIGELGLGIVPVDENGKCWFGAIDVDIDTIDHGDLYNRIHTRNIPLSVCRSKSGGAHLYVFFKEPQTATFVQGLLRKWAGVLGFPNKTEVFPKQLKSLPDNVGNWLNMPYFSANNTVRYAVTDHGSISVEEFLGSVKFYTGRETIDTTLTSDLIQIELMPPCLKTITREGLGSGTRNVGLFSYGVFYRKSSPNDWAEKLKFHNQNFVSPPLPTREVEALIKSLSTRTYQYKCNEEPLCSNCDRKTCLSLQYGVGHKPWEDESGFDDVTIQNLRKILTDPPTYIVEINSIDVHLNSEEFRTYEKIRKRILELQDLLIRPMKQNQWEQKMRTLLSQKRDIAAPDDASDFGWISSKIDDFLQLCNRSSNREDLLRSLPILEDNKILFQVDSMQKYLSAQKVSIHNQDLFAVMHRRGCEYSLIKIKGKVVRVWSIEADKVNRQLDEFTLVEFKKEEPEL